MAAKDVALTLEGPKARGGGVLLSVKEEQQPEETHRKKTAKEEEEEEEEEDQQLAEEENEDAQSHTSNQTEEEDVDEEEEFDGEENEEEEEEEEEIQQENERENVKHAAKKLVATMKAELPPMIRPTVAVKHLPAVLAVPVADPRKKNIQEPRPPRGSGTYLHGIVTSATLNDRKRAHKFQFPDAELLNLVIEQERASLSAGGVPTSNAPPSRTMAQRRRYSSTGAMMATALPLRRKSFSLTKSPVKNLAAVVSATAVTAPPAMSPAKSSRSQARRKSTSACYALRSGLRSPRYNKNLVSSLPPLARKASMSSSTAAKAAAVIPTSSASSQMVVRVRERKTDGIPELVISKRPARFLVWNWNDRQVRIPCMIQLGPHQHGIMLRQLRYVKSVMNDFPWAKTHLKELLGAYTKKDLSKEQLYPQLNQLSHQVQQELGSQVKKQKQLVVKKQHLTMQLSLATSVLNEMSVTKYGRVGKPHDTKLYYDPGQPTRLHWVRKNGDRSSEFLDVDAIEIHSYQADAKESELSVGIKKALKKFSQSASLECCLSLVTTTRTLDLQLKSPMHRDWLINALNDVISFARQYRAAGTRREKPNHAHSLRHL